jgi:hypothetical protein
MSGIQKNHFAKKQVRNLVPIDEIGMNHQNVNKYIWSPRGMKVKAQSRGPLRGKILIIAGIYHLAHKHKYASPSDEIQQN